MELTKISPYLIVHPFIPTTNVPQLFKNGTVSSKGLLCAAALKVHKIEIFFGFDFEMCNISLLVMSKYSGFTKKNF